MRSGWAKDLGAKPPFMQMTSLRIGWSRVVTLTTRPSSTLAATGQNPSQLPQTTFLSTLPLPLPEFSCRIITSAMVLLLQSGLRPHVPSRRA